MQQGQHYSDAELHGLRAEILLDKDGDAVEEADALFGQSLEIARRQEAKSLELRAATWFTEGFDTRDLIDAKALLGEPR